MISEFQQEQATLYALGLLDADEAEAFEHELPTDPALRDLVWELRDTAASLAQVAIESAGPPKAELRDRVLHQITTKFRRTAAPAPVAVVGDSVEAGKIIRPHFGWVPWAVAAVLLGCSVLLGLDRASLSEKVSRARQLAQQPLPTPANALSQVAFCELEPTPDAPVKPRAAVLWDPVRHEGVLRVTQLAPPAAGKDYQLWTVEAARKEPVNAGVVHVNEDGHADVTFKPDVIPGNNKVLALALSVEKAGGSPTNQGPVLFLGKF